MSRHPGGWDPSYENDMEKTHTSLTLGEDRRVSRLLFGLFGGILGALAGPWLRDLLGAEPEKAVSDLARSEAKLTAAALGGLLFATLAVLGVNLFYRLKYRGKGSDTIVWHDDSGDA